ncbi:hypothetical protein CC1G_06157 [Coprinopsis cinerea okayama7|uniref:DUF6533 domain-containing protein n=1 Tax=Coprinopsis cinerea (strain Okayama-7 / 130 / ATCC MYA-4618 / FGSC 9003) TaxID=240176 RepID=A8PAD3_COPC7|nr:hypothetical protein CC1G_06157 [Coprinopsis cinerea okayama7\|eukprot:XP_001839967.2 hypothetical protein CC1G_06157 [Coprinopsis cinerea okayama7\
MEDWDELSISLLVSRLRHVSYVHSKLTPTPSISLSLLINHLQTTSSTHNFANPTAAALVYNICDYAQTFELEVDYMWPGKWTLVKLVYFMGRYAGLLDYPLMFIHNHVGGLSTSTCSIIMHIASCSALIGASFGEVLLFLRVYVLSGCSRPVGWYLGIQYSLLFTAMFVLAVLTLKSVIYTPSPVPTHTGCYIHYASKVYITALYGLVLLQQTGKPL